MRRLPVVLEGRVIAALTLAVLSISSAAVVIRGVGADEPLTLAYGRVAVTGCVLTLLAPRATWNLVRKLRSGPSDHGHLLGPVLLAATLLALHFATWIASLSYTTVLRSVVLVCTQPLFAAAFAAAKGERVSPKVYLGSLIALLGITILVAPEVLLGLISDPGVATEANSTNAHEYAWLGDLLALAGAATAAGYLSVGRHLEARVQLRPYLATIHLIAAIQIFALTLAWQPELDGGQTASRPVEIGLAVLYLGLVPGILGHGLINWAVRRLPVYAVTLATMIEPLGASLLAYIILGETVSASAGLGALCLLAGVGLGLHTQTSK